jgi:hypothetical protein
MTDKFPIYDVEYINCLSTDQKYLYKMFTLYICHFWRFENLASHNPGNIFHARWLTIASRLLKIYIGYIKSPENLRLLVEFIVKVYRYAPTWLALKKSLHIWTHSFITIQYSKFLPLHVQENITT